MSQEPIRILHVIGIMHRGGAETMIMNYYRHIDRAKVQFDFVENSDQVAEFDNEIISLGGRIYRCPHYNSRNHFQYIDWWKQFFYQHANEYKIVHGHIGSTAAIYLGIAKKFGIYTIAHSHNTNHISLKDIIYRIYSYPTRYIADFFFGCSVEAGVSRYGEKICSQPERFMVLNNAIDTQKFTFNIEERDILRSKLGISDKIVIGHVGRFCIQKNHTFLIKIFKEIQKINPKTALLLIGDGELRSKIEEQIQQVGLTNSVVFTGVQNDVSPYYQAMDVFVFPSLYEGLGIAAVEAQTAGVPCVLSDKVSKECVMTTGLTTFLNLKYSAVQWAEHILNRSKEERTNHTEEVKNKGYDIRKAALWLEDFYTNIGE